MVTSFEALILLSMMTLSTALRCYTKRDFWQISLCPASNYCLGPGGNSFGCGGRECDGLGNRCGNVIYNGVNYGYICCCDYDLCNGYAPTPTPTTSTRTSTFSTTRWNPYSSTTYPNYNTCGISQFRYCFHEFFRHFGFSSTQSPNAAAFLHALALLERNSGVDGVASACRWMQQFQSCGGASSNSCWNVMNMVQLGYTSYDANNLLFQLWQYQYLCSTGYNTITSDFYCLTSYTTMQKLGSCDMYYNQNNQITFTCSNVPDRLSCIKNVYSNACGVQAGKIMCGAYSAYPKQLLSSCARNIDNVCNSSSSQSDKSFFIAIFGMIIAISAFQ